MVKMERFVKKYKNYILLVLAGLVFVLGVWGFHRAHQPILDAIFNTLILYVANYSDTPENNITQVARFLGYGFTGMLVLGLFQEEFVRWWNRCKAKKKDMLQIVGKNEWSKKICEDFYWKTKTMIVPNDEFYIGKSYLLIDEEEKNLQYYNEHKEELSDKKVYIRSVSIPGVYAKDNIRYFSLEEITARKYWEENDLFEIATEVSGNKIVHFKPRIQVAIIGMGYLGEEVLYEALLTNIFCPEQIVKYHVWGEMEEYCALHPDYDKLNIVPHDLPWFKEAELIQQMDRIIVVEQENTISLVHNMVSMMPTIKPHVILMKNLEEDLFQINRTFDYLCEDQNETQKGTSKESRNMVVFSLFKDDELLNLILQEEIIEKAKQIHFEYMCTYGEENGTKIKDSSNADEEWSKLSTFTMYSNISAASYKRILDKINKYAGNGMKGKQEKLLGELEHMRWCNYHWLNGWKYGRVSNNTEGQGKRNKKDMEHKVHEDLLPYRSLNAHEQEKDRVLIKAK